MKEKKREAETETEEGNVETGWASSCRRAGDGGRPPLSPVPPSPPLGAEEGGGGEEERQASQHGRPGSEEEEEEMPWDAEMPRI